MPDQDLLPGERLVAPQTGTATSPALNDSEIEDRYMRGEVRIVLEQARYPLKQVPDVVRSSDYNLQPDFQRRPRWSLEKRSRLIESLILNVPIPPIFLYEQDFGRYEVMDGRQRLTAISDFYANNFSLEGLVEWPELNGRNYAQLPEQVRRGVDRRFLSAIILLHETAKSTIQAERLKQLVFERINTGGEDLSSQEKRNALYPGPMNALCVKLSRTPALCRMWGIPEPDEFELNNNNDWRPPQDLLSNGSYKMMEDAELVLRFFAHRQRNHLWRGGTRYDEYLDNYLREANNFSSELLTSMSDLFLKTANLTFDVLGEGAFWLWRSRGGSRVWVERPTYIAYDPIMNGFSRLIEFAETLKFKAEIIRSELQGFYERNYEDFDGRKTNPADIRKRDEGFLAFLQGYLC